MVNRLMNAAERVLDRFLFIGLCTVIGVLFVAHIPVIASFCIGLAILKLIDIVKTWDSE